jgi:hypothetical protein
MRNVESRRAASPITFDGSLIHKMNDERDQGLIREGMPVALAVAGKYQADGITRDRSARNPRRKPVPLEKLREPLAFQTAEPRGVSDDGITPRIRSLIRPLLS